MRCEQVQGMALDWEVDELETSMEMSEHHPVLGLLLGVVFNWMLTNCMVRFSLKRPLFAFPAESVGAQGGQVRQDLAVCSAKPSPFPRMA